MFQATQRFSWQLPNVGNVEIGQTTSPWTCPCGFVKSAGALLIRYCCKNPQKGPQSSNTWRCWTTDPVPYQKTWTSSIWKSLEMIFLQFPLSISLEITGISTSETCWGTLFVTQCQSSGQFGIQLVVSIRLGISRILRRSFAVAKNCSIVYLLNGDFPLSNY